MKPKPPVVMDFKPERPLPSLGRMAMNAAGAAAAVARAAAGSVAEGRRPTLPAPESVVAERLAICEGCEWFDGERGRCRKCGCWMARSVVGKARLAAMACPLCPPKWGAWVGY